MTIVIQAIFYSGPVSAAVIALFWRWWRSRLGWSIVAKTLCLSLALLPAMLAYWGVGVARSGPVVWFTIVMLSLVPAVVWWRVWEIYRVQRRGGDHV